MEGSESLSVNSEVRDCGGGGGGYKVVLGFW